MPLSLRDAAAAIGKLVNRPMNATGAIRRIDPTERLGGAGPGLLVSVRDAEEAEAALTGGANVIDVKEPSAGPLGSASIESIAAVVRAVGDAALVTAAMGDISDRFPVEQLPSGIAIGKLGMAGGAKGPWREPSERWASRLPKFAAGALVAYADWRSAGAPTPEEVLTQAEKIGCRGFVVDTWSKGGVCALDLLESDRLRSLVAEAVSQGLFVVLAGSLTIDRIEEAASYGPTLVGVRGAACLGGRSGAIDTGRVRALAKRLSACRRGG